MAVKTSVNSFKPLDLDLSPRASRILEQMTEEQGIAIEKVVEIAICTGLPTVVQLLASEQPRHPDNTL
jgi:hypothetical protein